MQALEVLLNDRPKLLAGASNALLVAVRLSILVNGDDAATIDVSGMRDLGNDRYSHMWWLEEFSLKEGDELRLKLVNVEEATPPVQEVAADSEEHMAEQAAYEAEIEAEPLKASKPERKRPNACLEISVDDDAPIVADLSEERDLLMLSATWNNWHPERWRISLRSTSFEEAIERTGGKDWLSKHIAQGAQVAVRIGR